MITVLIADDHDIVRHGLRRVIAEHADMKVVGEVSEASDVIIAIERDAPDVLLLDLSMPGPEAAALLSQIRRDYRQTRVLIVSMHSEKQTVLHALRAGAAGYLTKDNAGSLLAEAIRRVYGGGRYIPVELADVLVGEIETSVGDPKYAALSSREYEVMCALAEGDSAKKIGSHLKISPKTVSTYRTRILEKLELENTADIIRYAIQHKLIGKPPFA